MSHLYTSSNLLDDERKVRSSRVSEENVTKCLPLKNSCFVLDDLNNKLHLPTRLSHRHQFLWEASCSHSETQSPKAAAAALKRYATTLALTNRLCPAVIRRFVVVWLRCTQWCLPSVGSRWDNRTSLRLHRPLRVRLSASALLRLGNVVRHAARGATWCSHRSSAKEKPVMLFTRSATIWPSPQTPLENEFPQIAIVGTLMVENQTARVHTRVKSCTV